MAEGHVYLVRDDALWRDGIFKVGKTKHWENSRKKSYSTGIRECRLSPVPNRHFAEKELIDAFARRFKRIDGKRKEYFLCSEKDAKKCFDEVLQGLTSYERVTPKEQTPERDVAKKEEAEREEKPKTPRKFFNEERNKSPRKIDPQTPTQVEVEQKQLTPRKLEYDDSSDSDSCSDLEDGAELEFLREAKANPYPFSYAYKHGLPEQGMIAEFTSWTLFYSCYEKWCKEKGRENTHKTSRSFARKLERYVSSQVPRKISGESPQHVRGFYLKSLTV